MGSDAVVDIHRQGRDISIHAPRVGSDYLAVALCGKEKISIHAPRVGSDRFGFCMRSLSGISIHAPRVGSDNTAWRMSAQLKISIHAPRVGSDKVFTFEIDDTNRFQSTLPVWGATVLTAASMLCFLRFQSTLPVWGATCQYAVKSGTDSISIHAPRVGSDHSRREIPPTLQISIHAPRVGSDFRCC